MTLQLSVPVRNARLDAIETTMGASAKLQIRTGVPPADCAAAATGTLLAELTLPADFFANAASGSKALTGTWSGAGSASGFAGHFRILNNAGSTCHLQGLCSEPWTAAKAYALNQQVHNGGNVYRCTVAGTSAGAGGPTGTGGAITDNTVTWAYVGTQDMALDNTNLANGQAVSITSFTLTDGNA